MEIRQENIQIQPENHTRRKVYIYVVQGLTTVEYYYTTVNVYI